ncbi:hypothetical protein FYJ33_10335 [Clostridiaceae bacterium WCA-383-APC-5B]|uniref:Uncharacterized protein n=1 Tax=Inconstantimicrobium porci TaxID=2652291 RepID=A0A7X2MZ62_9CLOT|nr:hypothetical protein [Inconstantimicrobium porci]
MYNITVTKNNMIVWNMCKKYKVLHKV